MSVSKDRATRVWKIEQVRQLDSARVALRPLHLCGWVQPKCGVSVHKSGSDGVWNTHGCAPIVCNSSNRWRTIWNQRT
eukprot:6132242-Amphidinium_carterae.2